MQFIYTLEPMSLYMKIFSKDKLVFVRAISMCVDKSFYNNRQNGRQDPIPSGKGKNNITYVGKSSYQLQTDVLHNGELTVPLISMAGRIAVVDISNKTSGAMPEITSRKTNVPFVEPLKLKRLTPPSDYYQTKRRVEKYTLDHNNHMNIMHYVYLSGDCLEEAFTQGYFTGHDLWLHPVNIQVRKMDVLMEKELVLDDIVTFRLWLEVKDNQTYLHLSLTKEETNVAFISMTFHNDSASAKLW